MLLDATAGNRMMWPNKKPPLTVFMDKEVGLARPPDLVGVWEYLPFRDDVFDCVIFDPPHLFKRGLNSFFNQDPTRISNKGFTWYGSFKNKTHCLVSLNKAQKEFSRVSKRLCLKWNEVDLNLWNVLPFFKCWKEIHRYRYKSRRPQSSGKDTYWVTFVRDEVPIDLLLDQEIRSSLSTANKDGCRDSL